MPLFGVLAGAAKLAVKGVKALAITKTKTGRTPAGNLLNAFGIKKKTTGTTVLQTTAASYISENLTSNDGFGEGISRKEFKSQKRANELNEEVTENKKQQGFVYLIYAGIAALVITALAFIFGRKGKR